MSSCPPHSQTDVKKPETRLCWTRASGPVGGNAVTPPLVCRGDCVHHPVPGWSSRPGQGTRPPGRKIQEQPVACPCPDCILTTWCHPSHFTPHPPRRNPPSSEEEEPSPHADQTILSSTDQDITMDSPVSVPESHLQTDKLHAHTQTHTHLSITLLPHTPQ